MLLAVCILQAGFKGRFGCWGLAKCHAPGSQLFKVTPADTFGAKGVRLPVCMVISTREERVFCFVLFATMGDKISCCDS